MAQIQIMTVRTFKNNISKFNDNQIIIALKTDICIDMDLISNIDMDFDNLEDHTIYQLREIGKKLKVKSPTSMVKSQLISSIKEILEK